MTTSSSSGSFQDQIENAMAEFTQQRARLAKTRSDLEKESVSESSKDHLLTVTVGMSGDVKEITFHSTDYAAMAPAELSALLVDIIGKARAKAAVKAKAAFSSLAGFGSGLRDSLAGSDELEKLFTSLEKEAGVAAKPRVKEEDDFHGR